MRCAVWSAFGLLFMAADWLLMGAVTFSEDLYVLPYHERRATWEAGAFKNGAMFADRKSEVRQGQVSFKRLRLSNAHLELWVFPQAGGAVARAIDKTTGFDIFYWEDKAKNSLPFWESGVKATFPYPEHGIATMEQAAAWRLITHADGAQTIAMWMEFSRHIGPQHKHMFGRYSPLLLSQFVTLRPGEASFSVRYRISNPVWYRQGRRCWNDAIFPRRHQASGPLQGLTHNNTPTDARWIYPVAWVSGHQGKNLRRLTAAECELTKTSLSLFSWDRQFGFVGVHHPGVDVNRLRLDDPKRSPGAKMWWPRESAERKELHSATDNIAEIWGGFDNVFEGVEQWLEPGESHDFTHRFCLVQGIGTCVYASEDLVLGRNEQGVHVLGLRALGETQLTARNGQTSQSNHGPCGPGTPLSIQLAANWAGQITISSNGQEHLRLNLPLTISDDTTDHARIAAAQSGPIHVERHGHAHNRGMQRSMTRTAPRSTQRGRILAMQGRLPEAIRVLRESLADDDSDGEAYHLLACCHMESGQHASLPALLDQALTAEQPFPAAAHTLAMHYLAQGDAAAARQQLEKLLQKRPQHWEAELLRLWLAIRGKEDQVKDLLVQAKQKDAADPRLAWLQFLYKSVDANRLTLARLLEEPGAAFRLAAFQATTQGRLQHPPRPTEE